MWLKSIEKNVRLKNNTPSGGAISWCKDVSFKAEPGDFLGSYTSKKEARGLDDHLVPAYMTNFFVDSKQLGNAQHS